MSEAKGRVRWASIRDPRSVVAAGLIMVAIQILNRVWALNGSWFYSDDYEYLRVARTESFGLGYLVEPHGGHILPLTRLLAYAVAHSGNSLNWTWAALSIVLLQLLASLAALWMLIQLFGRRWGILAPLAVYLTSAISIPATIWWAAALNQLGHQAGLFLAVAAWVQYERSRRYRWFGLVLAGVAFSFFCDARGLFIPPLLLMISLGWFSAGNLVTRFRQVLCRNWLSAATLAFGMGAYWVAYTGSAQEKLLTNADPKLAADLAEIMLGQAYTSGILGGPWKWNTMNPPTSYAMPPEFAVHAAWVIIVLVILHAALTRHRTLRAFVLVAVYVAALYAMVLFSRAPMVGALIGAEYRYLTDAAAITALGLALAYLPLPGAIESSAPRSEPMFTPTLRPISVVVVVGLVSVSGLWSSNRYVDKFRSTNAGRSFVANLSAGLEQMRPVALADQGVPTSVVTPLTWPQDGVRRLADLIDPGAAIFPAATDELAITAADGTLHRALLDIKAESLPGPVYGCGWRINNGAVQIPLNGRVLAWGWWLRIGYLAPQDMPIRVTAGDTVVDTQVKAGPNSLYVQNQGGFDSVRLSGLNPETTVCVDRVEVGTPVPGGSLS